MDIKEFKDAHKGSKFLVVGCGESAVEADKVSDCIVIGVNDIDRLLAPDYLLVVNARAAFKEDRWAWVDKTRSKYIFSHLPDLPVPKSKLVTFRLGKYRQPTLGKDSIDYSNNSPYMACILAYYMGASKVGVLGVDFTDNHFFGETGRHPLTGRLSEIQNEYRKLLDAFVDKNVGLYNLSSKSLLTSLPRCTAENF